MIQFTDIQTATLDQLTDELAAAGWDSSQTDINEAKDAVTDLLIEIHGCDVFTGENYQVVAIDAGQFLLIHPVSENEIFDTFEDLIASHSSIAAAAYRFFFLAETPTN